MHLSNTPQWAHAVGRSWKALVLATLTACGAEMAPQAESAPDTAAPVLGGGTGGGGGGGAAGGRDGGVTVVPSDAGASPVADSRGADDGPRASDASEPTSGDETSFLTRPVPVLWITLGGKAITRSPGVTGDLKLIEQHDGTQELKSIDGLPIAVATKVNVQLRGSSSSYYYAQKPYSIELQDDKAAAIDVSLLGMPKESDWVLGSCYSDKSCLRNALTYAIGREAGAAARRWAPKHRWVELYLDAKYAGLYLLIEKPKGNKGRVDLPHPAATAAAGDITGGYMFSADADKATYSYNPRDDTREFYDARSDRRWKYRFPKKTDYTPAQKAYVAKDFDDLQVLLQNKGAWRARIDVPSWIDYLLIAELSFNQDAFYKSWYFHKRPSPSGGTWFMGPIWDFDIAYGNTHYAQRYCTNISLLRNMPAVFRTPGDDPTFQNEMRCRWNELRRKDGPFDVDRLDRLIDAYASHIRVAKVRDARRWGNIGKFVWPNNYVGATFDDEVKYLKYWIHRHVPWVDARLRGTCTTVPAPPPVAPLPQPPQTANDMRMAQASASPAQWNAATDPPSFIPLDGPAAAKWACPP